MFISKREYNDIIERLEKLEEAQRQNSGRVYVNENGELVSWHGGKTSIVEAVNLLAQAVRVRWKQIYATAATVETEIVTD